jgi:hypothetical protein
VPRLASTLLASFLVVTPATLAQAAPTQTSVIVTAADPPGDVWVYAGDGPTASERGSIDLREVSVVARPNVVRFKVRLREVRQTREFDQMVFIDLKPTVASDATWTATIGMSPQQPTTAYATLFLDDSGTDYRSCDPLPLAVLRRQDTLRLDVPIRCVPREPARIKVTSYTGYYRSDAGGPWSKDALRVSGSYLLR